jgi:predicted ATPase
MNRKPKIPLDLLTTSNTDMAKLTVKNVGPIRDAELEVKKHTVFIGPQGTGKSTLAKLIAMGADYELLPFNPSELKTSILDTYSISEYFGTNSIWTYLEENYTVSFSNEHLNDVVFHKDLNEELIDNYLNSDIHRIENDIDKLIRKYDKQSGEEDGLIDLIAKFQKIKQRELDYLLKQVIDHSSVYIPAERILMAMLSEAIWSLSNANINLPQSFNAFASSYELARNQIRSILVPFLNLLYKNQQGQDKVIISDNQEVHLSKSASGYQSVIPLLLVVDYQRQQAQRRFIIEEPELNLYPTAQKDLIYSLMGGLQPDVDYKDAEWVITTHSPYVLSSFNTLMLAYKVAQRSEELRAEVEKIIPARCWINPDEFAAYYVDNGTVRSIISEKTGLIADNELDDVSEDLAGEQDQLLELSRSVSRA